MTEFVEICPYCDCENHLIDYDVKKSGYIIICETCGNKIFLCDACLHEPDNKDQLCDWHVLRKYGKYSRQCFRGKIIE